MNFIQVLIAVGAVFAGLAAAQIPGIDCGSKLGTISKLNVNGCTTDPCIVLENSNLTIEMNFEAIVNIPVATTSVHGIFDQVTIHFPLQDDNACHFMTCPVMGGTYFSYMANLFIGDKYPEKTFTLKWELKCLNEEVTCFNVRIRLQSSNP